MQFEFEPMNKSHAQAIAGWRYEDIYAFYDADQDVEDLEELLDPRNWMDKYWAVVDERGELVGFFCFEKEGGVVAVGLGLRPDCTGKGLGRAFVEAGLEFARCQFKPETFRLDVAAFNQRAIKVYERAGFKIGEVFMQVTNDGQYEFVRMVREA